MKTTNHSSEFVSSGSSPGEAFSEDSPGRMCKYQSEGSRPSQPAHAILPPAIPEKRKRGKV